MRVGDVKLDLFQLPLAWRVKTCVQIFLVCKTGKLEFSTQLQHHLYVTFAASFDMPLNQLWILCKCFGVRSQRPIQGTCFVWNWILTGLLPRHGICQMFYTSKIHKFLLAGLVQTSFDQVFITTCFIWLMTPQSSDKQMMVTNMIMQTGQGVNGDNWQKMRMEDVLLIIYFEQIITEFV